MEQSNKVSYLDKLKFRYRVVVIDDDTLKEKVSLTLSAMNLIIFIGSFSVFMIFLLTYIIAFTSLREYIPGYADVTIRRNIKKVALRSDSLLAASAEKDLYIANLQNLITDKVTKEDLHQMATSGSSAIDSSKLLPSDAEIAFRKEIQSIDSEKQSQNSTHSTNLESIDFHTPLKGVLGNKFNPKVSHYGLDIISQKNKQIKAVLNGTVVYSGLTKDEGFVLKIQHEHDIVSVYKQNSALLKKLGDKVKAGENVAIIGNGGEMINKPHLHLELWYKGKAINPEVYLKLK